MIDGLPLSAARDEPFTEPPTEAHVLTLRHGAFVPPGSTVGVEQLEQAHDAYLEAFDMSEGRGW